MTVVQPEPVKYPRHCLEREISEERERERGREREREKRSRRMVKSTILGLTKSVSPTL